MKISMRSLRIGAAVVALIYAVAFAFIFYSYNQKQVLNTKSNDKTKQKGVINTDTSLKTEVDNTPTTNSSGSNAPADIQEVAPSINSNNVVTRPESASPQSSTKPSSIVVQKLVTVEIQSQGTYKVELQDGDNAFTVLQRAAQKNNFTLNYQNYGSLGVMVKGINGINAHNNYYWAFYYNNQYSQVGASGQPVKEGDITTWKFETTY